MAENILAMLAANGIAGDGLRPDDLAPFEELHIGGREATEYMLGKLDLEVDHQVLDVGCGIGGAVRFVAHRMGCRVTGIDITPEFIQTAETLSDAVGLQGSTRFDTGSALSLPYEDESFDRLITLHAAMNIVERPLLYREMARVLKPGGKMALYDVMRLRDGELRFPVPWADTPDISHLLTPEETRTLLQEAGLTVLQEEDRSVIAPAFFNRVLSDAPLTAGSRNAMVDGEVKMRNTLANIEDGLIAPVLITAQKA
ncbi:class I SAM-dependent methyltransferase [Thiolapillus sp.]